MISLKSIRSRSRCIDEFLQCALVPFYVLTTLFVPGLKLLLYSLHGGPGYFLLICCGPYAYGRMLIIGIRDYRRSQFSAGRLMVYAALYILLTGAMGGLGQSFVERGFGFQFRGSCVWKVTNFPWTLAYSSGRPCWINPRYDK
jgi:hypothetical protein